MGKKWYVIHTYAGYEGKVKAALADRAAQMHLEDQIGEVLVPTEDVVEIREGKRRLSKKKFFPGYVLVQLETPVKDETVMMIKETPKVTGFVGGGATPVPLPDEEAEVLLKQLETGATAPQERIVFSKNEAVRIIDGPFMGFNGTIDEVDHDHKRVKALVSIFGRSTPVELTFSQIERA